MEEIKFNKGDEVTFNATVIGVTESGNPIVKFNSGIRMLLKKSDVNTVHPYEEPPKEDKRRGR